MALCEFKIFDYVNKNLGELSLVVEHLDDFNATQKRLRILRHIDDSKKDKLIKVVKDKFIWSCNFALDDEKNKSVIADADFHWNNREPSVVDLLWISVAQEYKYCPDKKCGNGLGHEMLHNFVINLEFDEEPRKLQGISSTQGIGFYKRLGFEIGKDDYVKTFTDNEKLLTSQKFYLSHTKTDLANEHAYNNIKLSLI